MKHLSNPGKNSLYIGVGRVVNKPRLQGLIYPGKHSVYIGVGRMGLIYLRTIKLYMVWTTLCVEETSLGICGAMR